MNNGNPTHVQFNSLQAFWPGLQVLHGDLDKAKETQAAFFSVWQKYDALPERYFFHSQHVHSTERHYILRPELIESTYFLYRATKDDLYLSMGERAYWSINNYTRVDKGFASLANVESKELEDRMNSFFLAETCKYLYLLFDEQNFAHQRRYIFTTEGHLFPVRLEIHENFSDTHIIEQLKANIGQKASKIPKPKLQDGSFVPKHVSSCIDATLPCYVQLFGRLLMP